MARPVIVRVGAPPVVGATLIIIWSGSVASIPDGFTLCDGTGGTPDLTDRFVLGYFAILGDLGDEGGSTSVTLSHSHTTATGDTNSESSHTHGKAAGTTNTTGNNNAGPQILGSGSVTAGASHAHDFEALSIPAGDAHHHGYSVSIGSTNTTDTSNLPPYYALCYISGEVTVPIGTIALYYVTFSPGLYAWSAGDYDTDDTSIAMNMEDATTYPSAPFVATHDDSGERMLVTARTPTGVNAETWTVQRGYQGTTPSAIWAWDEIDAYDPPVPAGFGLCDGYNASPDLRARFVIGAGDTYDLDDSGGGTGSIASHSHDFGTIVTGTSSTHTHPGYADYTDATSGETGPQANANSGSGGGTYHQSHGHLLTGGSGGEYSGGAHSHTLAGTFGSANTVYPGNPPYTMLVYVKRLS